MRVQLDALRELSQNSCKFESPQVSQSPEKFDAFVVGQDLRKNIFMPIGFYARQHNSIGTSYSEYTFSQSIEQFRERAKQVMDSVEVR
jgi:hypothetical protein